MNKVVSDKYQESYISETLPNGLKVILWQKSGYEKSFFTMATPMGAMDLEQEDEKGNRIIHPAGVAHFLEHKMFEDENGHDVMSDFTAMGANVNAATSYDETSYYFTTSQDPIPALNLLLDFTQQLCITDESVEKEKGIILQEYQMGYQMSDFRLIRELYTSLFHKHPLSIEVVGTEESISQMTKEDLMRCYELNYHPTRTVLVGVTGWPLEPILACIKENQAKKAFKKVMPVKRTVCDEPVTVAREYYECEMEIHTPKIAVAYKLKGIQDARTRMKRDWCLSMLLEGYFSSMNEDYQRWIREEVISDFFGCETYLGEDFGYMMFYGETKQLKKFRKLIDEVLAKAVHESISEAQMEQLKRRFFGQNIKLLNDFEGIGVTMFRNVFDCLDFFDALDIVDDITMDDMKETLEYMEIHHKATVVIQPKK